jgi:hypothetical protein
MTSPARWDRIINGIVIGSSAAVVLVLAVLMLSLVFGNQQQQALDDIRNSTRAEVCVLLLPVGDHGRSEAQTNSRCLIPNGIAPVDANGDGQIEFEPQP